MPKISVIVPNYNHEKYLKVRLESILNQSYQDFEILIIDDASTDQSARILKAYQDHEKVSYLQINKENSGSPFAAWQEGIQRAKGDIIWIAESDDLAHRDFLKEHLIAFDKDKRLLVSIAASQWIDASGVVIHEPDHEKVTYKASTTDTLKKELTKGPFIYNMSSALFQKKATKLINFEKLKSYKYAGDWYFWSSLLENEGTIQRHTERHNLFRRHAENVSFKADEKGLQFKEGLPIVKKIVATQQISFLQKQRILALWAQKLYTSSVKNKETYLKQLPLSAVIWYYLMPILLFILKK